MRKNEIIRSPFFYVGDKYKLMPQLKELMPADTRQYIEPFAGGGSSFLNAQSRVYLLNDIDPYVIGLHRAIGEYRNREEELFSGLFDLISRYGLSCSYKGHFVPEELKRKYPKTYYSRYNKNAYLKMRADYNADKSDPLKLYLLLIYGFNHMIRFNGGGDFNLPVGNVDFNANVYHALKNYLEFTARHELVFFNLDYIEFLEKTDFVPGSYVFLDPPYLISMSEYNKLWNDRKEDELCEYLDGLDRKGVKFGITNLITHKGRVNRRFLEWSGKYLAYNIRSNYISFNDNTVKADSREVFVTNFAGQEEMSWPGSNIP